MENLYTDEYKLVVKYIKEDLNKWSSDHMDGKTSSVKSHSSEVDPLIQRRPDQNLSSLLLQCKWQRDSKICLSTVESILKNKKGGSN